MNIKFVSKKLAFVSTILFSNISFGLSCAPFSTHLITQYISGGLLLLFLSSFTVELLLENVKKPKIVVGFFEDFPIIILMSSICLSFYSIVKYLQPQDGGLWSCPSFHNPLLDIIVTILLFVFYVTNLFGAKK